ncbi:MAG: hypothetical protein IKX83_05240 [Clostridia bacterium]|nr:hypothetical protein [Clostridia bacterium]
MQTNHRKITAILIALAVFLTTSISVLAIDEYELVQANGKFCQFSSLTSGNNWIKPVTSAYLENSSSEEYPAYKIIGSAENMPTAVTEDDMTFFYAEYDEAFDSAEGADFYFSAGGQGASNASKLNPSALILSVYSDRALTQKIAQNSDGTIEVTAHQPLDNDYAYGCYKIHVPDTSLEAGSEYYLVWEVGSVVGRNTFDKSLICKFTTAAAPVTDPEATDDYVAFQAALNNGNTNSLYMTTPDPAGIKTAGEQTYADGTKYWFNEITTPLNADEDQVFALDVTGYQANKITDDPLPAHYYFIYSDNSLSEDSLVASLANGKMTNATKGPRAIPLDGTPVPPNSNNGCNVSVTVPAGTLENGKTYYFVVDKAMMTQSVPTNTDYVFKFTTEAPEPQAEPALVSSEGTELKAKTNTTLTLENAPAGEGYTYKFIVYNTTTNQWYKLKDFGPETTFDWYTGPAGVKNLYVDIKDADGNVTRVALEGVNVTESDLAVKSFTISPEGTLPTKSQATLTAEAEKGEAPYEYKFIVYNSSTEQWYKLKDFGPEATFDWYTGPAGNKTLYVDVKDATGKVVRKSLNVTVQ